MVMVMQMMYRRSRLHGADSMTIAFVALAILVPIALPVSAIHSHCPLPIGYGRHQHHSAEFYGLAVILHRSLHFRVNLAIRCPIVQPLVHSHHYYRDRNRLL